MSPENPSLSDARYRATVQAGAPANWRERQLVKRLDHLHTGRLDVTLPGGSLAVFEGHRGGPTAVLHIRTPRMVTRLFKAGSIGFAEGYIAGDWDSPDLTQLIYLLHLNEDALEPDFTRLQYVYTALSTLRRWWRSNTRRGAKRNIEYHYDLGNDFYARWLDETWTYSSALFEYPTQDLADAQRHKYARLLERLDAGPDDHILEIGSGWGGFARYAAESIGCRVTGITLSEEQLRFAEQRTREQGLDDRVSFELRDYRDVRQTYDHVVSIEMYEAVGEAYWPAYFKSIFDALKPGGRAAIQAITIEDDRYDYYRSVIDFIQEYIFPGGMLASPEIFAEQARRQGLATLNSDFHGSDYRRTLMRWDEAVRAASQGIVADRGEALYRMWRYYLAYCAAGFTSGNIDLMQTTLQRT